MTWSRRRSGGRRGRQVPEGPVNRSAISGGPSGKSGRGPGRSQITSGHSGSSKKLKIGGAATFRLGGRGPVTHRGPAAPDPGQAQGIRQSRNIGQVSKANGPPVGRLFLVGEGGNAVPITLAQDAYRATPGEEPHQPRVIVSGAGPKDFGPWSTPDPGKRQGASRGRPKNPASPRAFSFSLPVRVSQAPRSRLAGDRKPLKQIPQRS